LNLEQSFNKTNIESNFFEDNLKLIIDEKTSFSKIVNEMFKEPNSSAILTKFGYINRKTLRMILKELFQ